MSISEKTVSAAARTPSFVNDSVRSNWPRVPKLIDASSAGIGATPVTIEMTVITTMLTRSAAGTLRAKSAKVTKMPRTVRYWAGSVGKTNSTGTGPSPAG